MAASFKGRAILKKAKARVYLACDYQVSPNLDPADAVSLQRGDYKCQSPAWQPFFEVPPKV